MENLLLLFENISSVNRALIMVSGITFFWIIEGIVPFKFLDYKKWRHSIPNFLLTITTIIVMIDNQSIPSELPVGDTTVTNISASVVRPSSFSIVQTTQNTPALGNT